MHAQTEILKQLQADAPRHCSFSLAGSAITGVIDRDSARRIREDAVTVTIRQIGKDRIAFQMNAEPSGTEVKDLIDQADGLAVTQITSYILGRINTWYSGFVRLCNRGAQISAYEE